MLVVECKVMRPNRVGKMVWTSHEVETKRALVKRNAVTCCQMMATREAGSFEMRLETDVAGHVAGQVGKLDCRECDAFAVSQSTNLLLLCL